MLDQGVRTAILSLRAKGLGIRQIAVLVNKMDLANFSEARFKQVEADYRAWMKTINVSPLAFIPISAKHGDNIASRGASMAWWPSAK